MTTDSPNHTEPDPADPDLKGTILDFTRVALERVWANGWSPLMQRRFIHALPVTRRVGQAAINGVATLCVLRGGSVSVTDIPSIAPLPHLLRCDFSVTFQL